MHITATPDPRSPRLFALALEGAPLGFALFPAPLAAGFYPIGLGFCPPAACFTAFVLAVPGTNPAEPYFLDPATGAVPPAHPLAVRLGKHASADGLTLAGGRILFNELLWALGRATETNLLLLLVA